MNSIARILFIFIVLSFVVLGGCTYKNNSSNMRVAVDSTASGDSAVFSLNIPKTDSITLDQATDRITRFINAVKNHTLDTTKLNIGMNFFVDHDIAVNLLVIASRSHGKGIFIQRGIDSLGTYQVLAFADTVSSSVSAKMNKGGLMLFASPMLSPSPGSSSGTVYILTSTPCVCRPCCATI